MKLLKMLGTAGTLLATNIFAATISGHVYCDLNGNGTQDPGEELINEAVWIKVLDVSKDSIVGAANPELGAGTFSFHVNATGDYRLFMDNNGKFKDKIPSEPANMLFSVPTVANGDPVGTLGDGSYDVTIVTKDDVASGYVFSAQPNPVCDCDGRDGVMVWNDIEIDGVMDDWALAITDPDNTSCDSGCRTDFDINKTQGGVIQSTGRNLVQFTWTGQPTGTYVYGYTKRVGSSTNTETFLFYKDGDGDNLMEDGDIALVASWQGNTGTVTMEICDYVVDNDDGTVGYDPMVWQPEDVGTPLLYPGGTTVPSEWVGIGDGYTIHGGLENCREEPGLIGRGAVDVDNEGIEMEWQVPWALVNMTYDTRITYHVSTMNAAVNDSNPPGQIDDNLASCPLEAPNVILDVNKTVDNPNPAIGENVTYTVTVSNSGDPTNSVVANDLLPDGVSYVSHSGTDWSCVNSGQDVNCTYGGTLGTGENTSFTIVAAVDNDQALWGATLTNNVCVESDETPEPDCDDENITIYTPDVLLQVTKTAANPTPYEGASTFYTVTVTNTGPDVATNIVVNDPLPSAGVDYTGYFSGDGNVVCTEGPANTINCSYGPDLAPGASFTFNILVDVVGTEPNTYINTACAHSDENLTDVCGSDSIAPLTPPTVALSVLKGVSNPTPLIGETITYGIVVSNVGETDLTNVVLNDIIPTQLNFVGYSTLPPSVGVYDEVTGVWSGFDLAVGASASLLITGTVNSTAVVGTAYNNEACAHADENLTDICDDIDITPRAADVTMLIDKTVDNMTPWTGENVVFTIVVTNSGGDTAHDVNMTDLLPAGVTYVSSSPTGQYNDVSGIWSVGTLAPGASSTLLITASVDAGTEGDTIINQGCVVAEEDLVGDCDDANLTVYDPVVIVEIQKIADVANPPEGADVNYTIIVNNIGIDPATNVQVVDDLPSGVDFVEAGGNGWACTQMGLQLSCTNPGLILQPGIPTSFDVHVLVQPGTAGTTQTNSACTWVDENSTLVCDDENITINEDLDLGITKVVNNPTPVGGEVINYTLVVTNYGEINATHISVYEDLLYVPELDIISVTPHRMNGVIDPGDVFINGDTWTILNLAAGESAWLEVVARVNADVPDGIYINNGVITYVDQDDTDPNNNQADAEISITTVPTLSEWGRMLLVAMMLFMGASMINRRRENI